MKTFCPALTALAVVFIVSQATAQPIPDTLWIRMDDGVRLDCTRFTPQGSPPPGGFPGIVFVHGLGGSKTSTEAQARAYADSAYLTLAYSVRGQGNSEGLSTCFSWRERRDLDTLLHWMAALSNVNDTLLGVSGGSQGGFHSWFAGVDNTPARAAAPENSIPERADNASRNGCYAKAITAEINYSSNLRLDTLTYPLKRLLLADKYDSVHTVMGQGRDFDSTQIASSTARYVMMGAWHDHVFPHNRVPGAFAVGPNRPIMYLGTGGHGSENSTQEQAWRTNLRWRFFHENLKGLYRGLDTLGPGIISLGPNWRHIKTGAWPPPGQTNTTYYLHTDGTLTTSPPGASDSSYHISHRLTNTGYTWSAAVNDNFNRVTSSFLQNRRTWRTAPLAQNTILLGIPTAQAWAKGPQTRFQVSLQIYDEPPSGSPTYLTMVSLGQRNNPDSTLWQTLTGEFVIIGWEIPAGHRIRVDWVSVNQTLTDTTLWFVPYWGADGTLTLGLDAAHLTSIRLPFWSASGLETGEPGGYAEPGLEVLPNPACKEASVTFGLSREGQVRLELYDLLGRKISTLQDGPLKAGPKSYALDTRDHPTGIYYLRLTLSDRQYTRSFLILR